VGSRMLCNFFREGINEIDRCTTSWHIGNSLPEFRPFHSNPDIIDNLAI